jgi:hypothetical protein
VASTGRDRVAHDHGADEGLAHGLASYRSPAPSAEVFDTRCPAAIPGLEVAGLVDAGKNMPRGPAGERRGRDAGRLERFSFNLPTGGKTHGEYGILMAWLCDCACVEPRRLAG